MHREVLLTKWVSVWSMLTNSLSLTSLLGYYHCSLKKLPEVEIIVEASIWHHSLGGLFDPLEPKMLLLDYVS